MFLKGTASILLALSIASIAAAGEVTIGSIVGLTGPNASTSKEGTTILTGYVDMVNDNGGINGNKLKHVIKDDQYDPAKTAVLADEAITQDGALALINAVGTANAMALMKTGVLSKHKVPLVGVFSGADVIRGPGSEQIFHTRASYSDEIMKISRLASTLGLKRIAVLYQDDGFGASIMQSITKASEEYQLEVIHKEPYKAGETDFAKHARQVVAAKPQAIFLMGVPEAVIRFMKAYDAPVGASQIYSLSFVPVKMLVALAGEQKVRGMGVSQVVPNPDSAVISLAKDFQKFLKSPYGKGVQSNAVNFEVYLNVRLVAEAIRLAGPKPTPEKVTRALMSMNNFELGGYPISFSETARRGSQYIDIAVIGRNGRLNY